MTLLETAFIAVLVSSSMIPLGVWLLGLQTERVESRDSLHRLSIAGAIVDEFAHVAQTRVKPRMRAVQSVGKASLGESMSAVLSQLTQLSPQPLVGEEAGASAKLLDVFRGSATVPDQAGLQPSDGRFYKAVVPLRFTAELESGQMDADMDGTFDDVSCLAVSIRSRSSPGQSIVSFIASPFPRNPRGGTP